MARHHPLIAAASLLGGLALHGTVDAALFSKEQPPDEQRAEIRKVRDQTLEELYRVQPEARHHIQKSAGYAVFSNFGVEILVAGGGSGTGIAIDDKARTETFMRMAEVQAGLGIGVKKFRLV